MGLNNDHSAFKLTSIKKTNIHITPSIEMNESRVIRTKNILEHHRVSLVANSVNTFPEDPELNEITYKDGQLWIYKKVDQISQWMPISGGEGSIVNISATNVIEDNSHRFVTEEQLNVIQEVADGLIPAPKIIQDSDNQFVNQTQINAINDVIEGVDIDGGNLV